MVASAQILSARSRRPPPSGGGEQRFVAHGVSWQTYVLLNDALEQPSLKVSYYRGALEIMTKSGQHEGIKKVLARLLELFALERDVRLYGYGETTFRDELERAGLEPDECYTIDGPLQRVPHLAIEVVLTGGGVEKLPIYRALGVREVWIFEGGVLAVHRLGVRGYERAKTSALLPGLDLAVLVRHATLADQDGAVRAYRDWLRAKPARKPRRRTRA